jgi:hypothetical protein
MILIIMGKGIQSLMSNYNVLSLITGKRGLYFEKDSFDNRQHIGPAKGNPGKI